MCRLFVFAKADNDHPDPDLDWTKFKRGDVIDILEDGVFGGNEAEKSGLFRIIEIPDVPVKEMLGLVMGDPVQEGDTDHPRWRANRLDLDAIEGGAKPAEPVMATKDDVLAVRSTVARQPKSATLIKAEENKRAVRDAAELQAESPTMKPADGD